MSEPERILIVRTDRIGDVVLSTPVIENIRSAHPKSYIAFLCRPYTKDLLINNPYLDEVIVYDKYGNHKSVWQSIKFSFSLRKKRFDWAVILHPTNRVHLMTFFAGIPLRAGWDKKKGFLLTERAPHTKQEGKKHELDYTLDIPVRLGVPVRGRKPYISVCPEAEEWCDRFFKEKGLSGQTPIVALGIGASCPSKIWPTERFVEAAERLKAEAGAKILVIGSKSERELIRPFLDNYPYLIDLTGQLDIKQLSSLFRRISLFISNDSGLVHICAGVETPVISVFGRNQPGLSPQRWRPLGKDSYFIHKNTGCNPCLAHNCEKGFICLNSITSEEVLGLALEILKSQV